MPISVLYLHSSSVFVQLYNYGIRDLMLMLMPDCLLTSGVTETAISKAEGNARLEKVTFTHMLYVC